MTSGQSLFDGAVLELPTQFSILSVIGAAPTGEALAGTLFFPTLNAPGTGLITFTPTSVPEPATLLLVGLGAAFVAGCRMRRGD